MTLYVQFWAPDDGRKNRLKHVERLTEINKFEKRCISLVVLWEKEDPMLLAGTCSKDKTNVRRIFAPKKLRINTNKNIE